MGMEREGRVAVQERAMAILPIEAAAARRRLQVMPEHMRREREEDAANGQCGGTHPGRVGDGGTNARNHVEPLT